MRPRTFILIILIVVVLAVAGVLFVVNRSNGLFGGSDDGEVTTTETTTDTGVEGSEGEANQEPVEPPPTATPSVFLQSVAVARTRLPVGTRLTAELLDIEQRPNTNIALQGGYSFDNIDELVGQIVKVEVQRGDAILRPMLAIEASDLASFGSDLSLYVDRGRVAVAFPFKDFTTDVTTLDPSQQAGFEARVAQEKGIAFTMRPGDLVDIMMTTYIIEIDPDFRTELPNVAVRFVESEFFDGFFLPFQETAQGRLEFIPELNQVVEIVPANSVTIVNGDVTFNLTPPIPKRVTQLAIQQAEVLWVGTWFDRQELEQLILDAAVLAPTSTGEGQAGEGDGETTAGGQISYEPPSLTSRIEDRPDVVILSMPPQDAIGLKWAIERGLDIDLALRAQGDVQTFDTASVSLFQIIEQGGVAVPPPVDFDIFPRPEAVTPPFLPPAVLSVVPIPEGQGDIEFGEEIQEGEDGDTGDGDGG